MSKTIHHIRSKNHPGGLTLVTIPNKTTNTMDIHYAICSPSDQFCKKTGVSTALESKPINVQVEKLSSLSHAFDMLIDSLPSSRQKQIFNSIVHSYFGFSYKHLNNIFGGFVDYEEDINELIKMFLNTSNEKQNNVSLHELHCLYFISKRL